MPTKRRLSTLLNVDGRQACQGRNLRQQKDAVYCIPFGPHHLYVTTTLKYTICFLHTLSASLRIAHTRFLLLNFLVYKYNMSASSSSKITKRSAETSGSPANPAKRLRASARLASKGDAGAPKYVGKGKGKADVVVDDDDNSEYVDESDVHSDAEDIGSTERDWVEEPDYNPIDGEELVDDPYFEAITPVLSTKVITPLGMLFVQS
jgi:hypothetical protein